MQECDLMVEYLTIMSETLGFHPQSCNNRKNQKWCVCGGGGAGLGGTVDFM